MTEMTPVEALFFATLRQPPPQRAAYLDHACAGDADLRQRVDRLLAAHPQVGRFLETPPPDPRAAPTDLLRRDDTPADGHADPCGPAEGIGAVLAGRYQLLQVIGEGGMGKVFLAQQHEPVQRLVGIDVSVVRGAVVVLDLLQGHHVG